MTIETVIIAVIAPVASAIVAFVFTKRKYQADAIGSEIQNVGEVAKLWRDLASDMQKRYTELTKEVAKLRTENESLSKQLKELRKLVSELKGENAKLLDAPCKLESNSLGVVGMVALVSLGLMSCSPRLAPVTLHDSTSTNIVERIIEVPQPIDSALVKAYLKCDSLGNVYIASITQLQGERVTQELNLTGNTLTVTAKDESTKQLHERIVTIKTSKEKPVPVPYEVNRLTSWQAFQIWIGRLVLIALTLWGLYRFVVKGYLSTVLNLFKKIIQ